MNTKVVRELLNCLEDKLASHAREVPEIQEVLEKIHAELEQSEDEEGEVSDPNKLPPVPLDSESSVDLEIGDLLVGRGEDKFPQHDANLLLSAVCRKHAGELYHMRWGDEGEIEATVSDVVKLRLEKMQNGVRLRFLRLNL